MRPRANYGEHRSLGWQPHRARRPATPSISIGVEIKKRNARLATGSIALAAALVLLPAVAASADEWSGSRTCSSPATQSRLSSTTTGFTEHYRGGVRGGWWLNNTTMTYRASFYGLGTATFKVVTDMTFGSPAPTVACIGS